MKFMRLIVFTEVFETWNNLGFGANDIPPEDTGEDKEKELV